MYRILNIVWISVIIFSMIGCKRDSDKQLHYSDDTIKGVMIDLYIASEAIKNLRTNEKDSLSNLYREQISSIHGVDLELIEEDISMMSQDGKRYQEIHTEVEDSIDRLEKIWKTIGETSAGSSNYPNKANPTSTYPKSTNAKTNPSKSRINRNSNNSK